MLAHQLSVEAGQHRSGTSWGVAWCLIHGCLPFPCIIKASLRSVQGSQEEAASRDFIVPAIATSASGRYSTDSEPMAELKETASDFGCRPQAQNGARLPTDAMFLYVCVSVLDFEC